MADIIKLDPKQLIYIKEPSSLSMSQLKLSVGIDFEVIQQIVSEILKTEVKEVDFVGKSENIV